MVKGNGGQVGQDERSALTALATKRAVKEEWMSEASRHGRARNWLAKKEAERLAKDYERECETLEAKIALGRKPIAAPCSRGFPHASVPKDKVGEQMDARSKRFGPTNSRGADSRGSADLTRSLRGLAVKPIPAKLRGGSGLVTSPVEPKLEPGIPSLATVGPLMRDRPKKPETVLWPTTLPPFPSASVAYQDAWRNNEVIDLSDDETETNGPKSPQTTRNPRSLPNFPTDPSLQVIPEEYFQGATAALDDAVEDDLILQPHPDEDVDDDVSFGPEHDDRLLGPDPAHTFKNRDVRLKDGDPIIVLQRDKC